MAHRNFGGSRIQHVFNRGVDRQDIFTDDGDREDLVGWMVGAFERHNVQLHSYALMSNHYHLLVEFDHGSDLSDAMRLFLGAYVWRYNRTSKRDGPLFRGRFANVPVSDDEQFLIASRYVDRNPLDLTAAERLVDYPWSSLGAHAGRRDRPDWLTTDRLWPMHHSRVEYLAFVLRELPSDRLGSGLRPPLRATSLASIEAAVETVFGLEAEALHRPERTAPFARSLAMTLAVSTRAATTAQIALRYGVSSPQVVRANASRFRRRAARNGALQSMFDHTLSLIGS